MPQYTCLQDCETEYIQNIPGRARIRNYKLKNSPGLCTEVTDSLSVLQGIRMTTANPYTGKILVIYEPNIVSIAVIGQYLDKCLGSCLKKKSNCTSQPMEPISMHDFANCRYVLSGKFYEYNRTVHLPPGFVANQRHDWHTMPVKDIERELHSDITNGLTKEKCEELLAKYGMNELGHKKGASLIIKLLRQFDGFIIKLLLTAAGISLILGEAVDAATIFVIIGVEALLGAWQEHKAERTLSSLKKLSAPTANVIRGGSNIQIDAGQVVPGDIISLEAGSIVPADARLIESLGLEVDESSLTGESAPAAKAGNIVSIHELPLGDRVNMVYMGTSVVRGNAKAIVVATGMDTELGRIAGMLDGTSNEKTPLQKDLNKLARFLSLGCIGICAFITIGGIMGGQPFVEMLATGVSLAVGAIPEGLTAVLAISMAFSARRMAGKKAVIKTLPAVETLSCTKVICVDKTGTLTKNEMTVKKLYTYGRSISIDGSGYNATGVYEPGEETVEPGRHEVLKLLLTAAALCNNSEILKNPDETFRIKGDPTEAALLIAVEKSGISLEEFKCYKREYEIPFAAETKKMTTVCSDSKGNYIAFVKGAVDSLITGCARIMTDSGAEELDQTHRNKILAMNEEMAENSLRVIALAYMPLEAKPDDFDSLALEGGMIFLGLAGIIDPPRPEVKTALEKCRKAGIKVVMITGDHQTTAASIARSIGLLTSDSSIMTGDQLENMSEDELTDKIDDIRVFARTSPEKKLMIVKAFKRKGYVVAMTGDGVNDAPALKEAHIGIAMGRSGTDTAKEASSIILLDDNFDTVVKAVEEGRTINRNVKKFVKYVLTGNLAEVMAIFLATITGSPSPLIPAQILMLNLVTEGIPALSLGLDPPERDIMDEPPRNPSESILDSNIRHRIVTRGIATGITTLGIFGGASLLTGNLLKARTMAFTNLVACQMLHVFECSSMGVSRNVYLVPSVLVSAGITLASIYISPLNAFFGLTPLGWGNWLTIALSSAVLSRIEDFLKDVLYLAKVRQRPSFGVV